MPRTPGFFEDFEAPGGVDNPFPAGANQPAIRDRSISVATPAQTGFPNTPITSSIQPLVPGRVAPPARAFPSSGGLTPEQLRAAAARNPALGTPSSSPPVTITGTPLPAAAPNPRGRGTPQTTFGSAPDFHNESPWEFLKRRISEWGTAFTTGAPIDPVASTPTSEEVKSAQESGEAAGPTKEFPKTSRRLTDPFYHPGWGRNAFSVREILANGRLGREFRGPSANGPWTVIGPGGREGPSEGGALTSGGIAPGTAPGESMPNPIRYNPTTGEPAVPTTRDPATGQPVETPAAAPGEAKPGEAAPAAKPGETPPGTTTRPKDPSRAPYGPGRGAPSGIPPEVRRLIPPELLPFFEFLTRMNPQLAGGGRARHGRPFTSPTIGGGTTTGTGDGRDRTPQPGYNRPTPPSLDGDPWNGPAEWPPGYYPDGSERPGAFGGNNVPSAAGGVAPGTTGGGGATTRSQPPSGDAPSASPGGAGTAPPASDTTSLTAPDVPAQPAAGNATAPVTRGLPPAGSPTHVSASGLPTIDRRAKGALGFHARQIADHAHIALSGAQEHNFGQPFNSRLAQARARFKTELDAKPWLREKFLRILYNEQGRHPQGTQGVAESAMTRALVRGTSLEAQLKWHGSERGGYYAMGNMGRGSERYRNILNQSIDNALNGSNITYYATDNSSGSLAARERATGKFLYRVGYGGESFFAPAAREQRRNAANWQRLVQEWDQPIEVAAQ